MALCAVFAISFLGCKPALVKRTAALPSEVYVWQRSWKPEITASVSNSKGWLQAYHLLAAEVRFEKGEVKTTRIQPDKAAMAGLRVGLVIRIFPSAAKTGWDVKAVVEVVDLVKSLVAEWPEGSLAEVQLDYDCPDSKLPDFTRLLTAVKEAVSPLPVSCTALPSWLREKEFADLAAVAPGYVLQVHSLHLPDSRGKRVALVDLEETDEAVARAVKIGVPFRVALPTYSCVVEFDAAGKVREVYAEDVPQALPLQSSNYLVLDADAYGMTTLVSKWRNEASPLMKSVVWYRLPVAGDRLNWSLDVMKQVVEGTPLKRGWKAECKANDSGVHEIRLRQAGDAPDDLPLVAVVTWRGAEPAAADALRGYRMIGSGPGYLGLELEDPGRLPRAAPGTEMVIGWLRLEREAKEMNVSLKAAQ
ncbi:uncharacterized protein DUF3142 [Prosthecobacter fusiformis]|uniref:Uncharacterized protein DUF3142 n=2 Tax=Prosthecobacter fusiformis TaxID=48464 RepID=A0A4R7S3J1_9BACT|nr:uncharacterized protein DUF3142 [Prosthecobacter fusiformis]